MGTKLILFSVLACLPSLASSVSLHESDATAAETRPDGLLRHFGPFLDLAVSSQTRFAEDLASSRDSAGLNMSPSLLLETEAIASLDSPEPIPDAFDPPPASTLSGETSPTGTAFLVIILLGATIRFLTSATFYAFVENVLDVLSPLVPY
jgi:hypothetical protein